VLATRDGCDNNAGTMAKYFATSFAIENVVMVPCDQQLLSYFNYFDQLCWIIVQVNHVACFFCCLVPLFMATPTSACASAGASLVPSPSWPPVLLLLFLFYISHFIFWLLSAIKSSHAFLQCILQLKDYHVTITVFTPFFLTVENDPYAGLIISAIHKHLLFGC
jgi:hypothetical protein